MINVKEAHKLYDETFTKKNEKFHSQAKAVQKELENFVTVEDVDKYLDILVKESIAEGMYDARFSTKDFLTKMNLTEKWNEKKKELTEKYDAVFDEKGYNSPDRLLDGEVAGTCSEVLSKNEYFSVNRYKHVFTWEMFDENKQPKIKFLEKIMARKQDSDAFDQYLAESRYKREEKERAEEETRKMIKFAKILAKELKVDSEK